MPTGVGVTKTARGWEPVAVRPLDEAMWQTWKAKGREQDRQRGLLFSMVAASAVTLMVQAMQARQMPFAAAFALIAALLAASAIPFSAPLLWRDGKELRNA